MTKTGWYRADQKPVRKGWYEVKGCWCNGRLYWDGVSPWWFPWRGLTEKAK